jgi:hypothetical protein
MYCPTFFKVSYVLQFIIRIIVKHRKITLIPGKRNLVISHLAIFLLFYCAGEYVQNVCPGGDPLCEPCPERLPSCIGLPDGHNPHPYHIWGSIFITCYKNRTLDVDQCTTGQYFHPRERTCKTVVKTGTSIYALYIHSILIMRCQIHLSE